MKKRQYRSNQGRNPKKEDEIFKVFKVAFVLLVITVICSIIIT